MNVLVVGGAGYIGSHCVRELIAAGHKPVVLDNLVYGHRAALPASVRLHESNLGDEAAVKAILAQESYPNSSVAVGRSERGAIMHLKSAVIDSAVTIHGSTNWSAGGEGAQDNELIVEINPKRAARATTRIAAIHTHMLQVDSGGG